ncbi:MAG: hypothetical protein RIT35_1710 [Pseudomonadota bacterium]|jgi:two-component system osmolarity sensor histidine kinase EnvZ
MFYKKFIPQSLFYRFLLIIIIPTILSQLVATYIFYNRHWSNVTENMTQGLVGEVAALITMVEEQGYNTNVAKITHQFHLLHSSFSQGHSSFNKNTPSPVNLLNLQEELTKKISYDFTLGTNEENNSIIITIPLKQGVLTITSARKRIDNYTTYIFIMWMIGTTSIFLILSIIFIRKQIRSITKLSDAADKLGKGQLVEAFKPEGAIEVRKAAIAFFKMKKRIDKQIFDRTRMLAGVSHDLRTPLTRMKLQLAMVEQNDDILEMQSDIIHMEQMINGYLDFARGGDIEASLYLNLSELLSVIVASYRHQESNITTNLQAEIIAPIKLESFKRAIYNLIDNSLKFAIQVEIIALKRGNEVVIIISDNGPGIKPEERENVFRPFYRLDQSRNSSTGGIGLGMAIAKDAINFHGGRIALGESHLGGLEVTIILPL